jgi:hypothetical protein
MMGQASTVKSKSENSGARAGAQLFQSESWNPESPHPPDYTDDEEKTSIGVDHTTAVEALQKLKWPENHGNLYEEDAPGIGIPNSPIEQKVEKPGILESTKQSEDSSTEEYDGTEEEDCGSHGGGSDEEELPVLPKVPVKQKLMSEACGSALKNQKGSRNGASVSTKKQRTPLIDAAVITQLEFGPRPMNSVSTTLTNHC